MRTAVLTLLIALLIGCADRNPRAIDPALERTLKQQFKAQAELVIRAMEKEEHDTFIELTHPKLVEMMGGRAGMRAKLVEIAGELRQFEKTVTLDDPSDLLESTGRWYGVVPYTLELRADGRSERTRTALVGVSTDGGITWRFIDVQPKNVREVRATFPDIPRDLDIPTR